VDGLPFQSRSRSPGAGRAAVARRARRGHRKAAWGSSVGRRHNHPQLTRTFHASRRHLAHAVDPPPDGLSSPREHSRTLRPGEGSLRNYRVAITPTAFQATARSRCRTLPLPSWLSRPRPRSASCRSIAL
jgi:hypothetical protein